MTATEQKRIRAFTGGVICFTLAIWAAWDLFALMAGGKDATISGVLADYAVSGRLGALAAMFAAGMVTAHLIGWTRR